MDRRGFLSLLAGAAVAAATGALKAVRVGRSWRNVEWSPWMMPMSDPGKLVSHIKGERSDGTWFVAFAPVSVDATAEEAEMAVQNAQALFDEFLDCDCVVGTPCAKHFVPDYPAGDEKMEMPDAH